MLKIQEFWCDDFPTDEEIKEAILYAATHNCISKLIFNCITGYFYRQTSEYIFPDDTFDIIHERFERNYRTPRGLFMAKEDKRYDFM